MNRTERLYKIFDTVNIINLTDEEINFIVWLADSGKSNNFISIISKIKAIGNA